MFIARKKTTVANNFFVGLTVFRDSVLILTSFICLFAFQPCRALAGEPITVHGRVFDPLGAIVVGATVDLLADSQVVAHATSQSDGSFTLTAPAPGRYAMAVSAATFRAVTLPTSYIGESGQSELRITLSTQVLAQEVTVTANGTPTPIAQIGASVAVLPTEEYRYMPEVQDPLRLVPGLQITQTGQMGGTSGLSIRGGATDANKVLIDGVPANTIGGGVEFANLSSVGLDTIEVLREPNSAMYGSDALAGVVSMTSKRGSTRLPLISYAGDAGNFGTYRDEVTAGTAYKQFDLYSAFARMDTRNNIPNSLFHNATYAGNFGWTPNATNDIRFTVRHIIISGGQPNAIALYGIPDDAQQKAQDDYYGVVWNNQTTTKLHNEIRYGGLRQNRQFNSFGATGIFDPVFGIYDGAPVTIRGGNGYSVSGQAAFQFSGDPSQFLTPTTRDFVYSQSDYHPNTHVTALGAFKYEHESGSSGYAGASPEQVERGNYSYTAQISGDVRNRLFYNLGTGLEDNGLFGFAATPRASLAYYLVRPEGTGFFTGTKLNGSFGKGIKEPSVFQQSNSLFGTLLTLPDGLALIHQYHVVPIGPENSRTFDGGVTQQLLNSRGLIGITYFHNQFTNGAQDVPQAALGQFGVSPDLAANFPFGAYLSGSAFRSMGIEFESEYRVGNHFFARGGYTYTDAVVQHSVATASFNPDFNFGSLPIGAFAPLVGARPFRVAPHTGYFGLNYMHPRFDLSLTGTLVGRRDDSDFLSDSFFGNSLLLPNRNLLDAYQRLELGGSYQLTSKVDIYSNIQNLLSEHYEEAFGFPALPFTFRSGIKLNFGGESWKLR